MQSNKEKYPECWSFFAEHARNMEHEPESVHGKYRVPKPDLSGDFLYNDDIGMLFVNLKREFYRAGINSPSTYAKIQFIVENL